MQSWSHTAGAAEAGGDKLLPNDTPLAHREEVHISYTFRPGLCCTRVIQPHPEQVGCSKTIVAQTASSQQAGRSRDRRAEGRLAGAAGQNRAQVDLQSTTQALKPPVYLSQRYENVRGSLCAYAGQRLTHSCKNAPYSGLCFGRLEAAVAAQ